jgi:site-specific DNA recombinase
LRGTIYCSDCGARLVYSQNTGNGGTYEYFMCVKKKTKANNCRRPAVRLERIDEGISVFYARFQVSGQCIEDIRTTVFTEMNAQQAAAKQSVNQAKKRHDQLEDERRKLLQAHYVGAIPQDLLASEKQRLTCELIEADTEIRTADVTMSDVRTTLDRALRAASHCQSEYQTAPPKIRRHINQGVLQETVSLAMMVPSNATN